MSVDKDMMEWAKEPYPIIHSQSYIDMLLIERAKLVRVVEMTNKELEMFDKENKDVL